MNRLPPMNVKKISVVDSTETPGNNRHAEGLIMRHEARPRPEGRSKCKEDRRIRPQKWDSRETNADYTQSSLRANKCGAASTQIGESASLYSGLHRLGSLGLN